MKRKLKGFFGALLLIPTVSFIVFYLFVSLYYTDGFTFNTRINGVYCTGRSVEEVNKELIETTTPKVLYVNCEKYGTEEEVLLSDIDYKIDYTNALEDIFGNQNPFLWILNASKSSPVNNVRPDITFDSAKLYEKVNNLQIVKDHTDNAHFECRLAYSKDKGYFLYENIDELIDVEAVDALSFTAVTDDLKVNITDECFTKPGYTEEMVHDRKLWADISGFLTPKLSYDMGDEPILLDTAILSSFLLYDANNKDFIRNDDGSLFISETSVNKFIDELFDKYDTYQMPRKFVTHLGEVKDIKFSIYGTLLNRKVEKEYLINALKTGEKGIHVPTYIHEPFSRGLNDIGDTYVEVDMTRQTLCYIKDGEEKMLVDVVTGKPSAGYSTPEMLCYVYRKIPGKYLRGEDYCSWVNFWMPIYKSIGLHDASWQSKFGGNRYLTHGSRGCINMRYDDAKALYDEIEIGTPVIVFK